MTLGNWMNLPEPQSLRAMVRVSERRSWEMSVSSPAPYCHPPEAHFLGGLGKRPCPWNRWLLWRGSSLGQKERPRPIPSLCPMSEGGAETRGGAG